MRPVRQAPKPPEEALVLGSAKPAAHQKKGGSLARLRTLWGWFEGKPTDHLWGGWAKVGCSPCSELGLKENQRENQKKNRAFVRAPLLRHIPHVDPPGHTLGSPALYRNTARFGVFVCRVQDSIG